MRLIAPFLLMTLLAGCRGAATDQPTIARPTADETLTLAALVGEVNENNTRIGTLWAKGPFEADLREAPSEPSTFVNGDAITLYMRPDKLRIKGSKPVAGTVFDLGSDGERFFLLLPTEKTLYTGTFDNIDPEAVQRLPVRPDLILEVLAVAPLDEDLLAEPSPNLRYNPDADVYMLTYDEVVNDPADPPARRAVVKEIWYDRRTLLPNLVILFDRDGDPTLRANLSRHARVGGDDGGPRLATRYALYFPQTASTLDLELVGPDEPDVRFKSGRFPLAANFRAPGPESAERVVDLDRPTAPSE